jgi:F-type H+-transporting ATPase subunit b
VNVNSTLFAQIVVFLILAWFTLRFVWPPIMKALDERAEKISAGLSAAERGHEILDLAAQRSAETIREGKEKAAEMALQADQRAQQIIDDAREQARADAEKAMSDARAEINLEVARVKDELRERLANLVIAATEKILLHEVDAKAHAKYLDAIKMDL